VKRLRALITITRPLNVAIAALSVVIGALTGPGSPAVWAPLVWAALSAALITAGGNTLNDVADFEIDRVNKPFRPLPSGILPVRTAAWWSVLLLAGGVVAAYPLPAGCRAIVICAAVVIPVYDLWGKGRPLIGNLMVSLISALAFLYGSLAVGRGLWGLIPGVMAFLFHFGREIIKDLEDVEADRTAGLRTWPLTAGEGAARLTAQAVLVVLLIVLPLPQVLGWLGVWYLVVVLPGVAVPMVVITVGLSRQQDSSGYGRFQRIMKWDMLVGLMAVLAG